MQTWILLETGKKKKKNLKFGVSTEDQLCQVWDGAGVHHGVGQLGRVFADVTQCGGCYAFEGHLWLQQTQHQDGDGSSIHHRL